MGIKNSLILFVMCIFVLLPFFSSVCAEDNVAVNIHMLGEDARTRFGNPVIVAGIWHYINVTLENQVTGELILKFYQGDSMPSIGARDETNYYEWKYNANIQVWTDENEYEYSYINTTNCKKTSNIYSFCVGVKDTFPAIADYYENWTLEILNDENKLYSENVVLEKPVIGPAKYHADLIKFYVDPFTETDISNYDEYFIIENVGNVPININIDYGSYNDYIEVTNSSKKLSPYSTFNHYVTLHSESWKPGILEISGSKSSGSIPNYLIITTAAFTFELSQQINAADLKVFVGHSNYEIEILLGTNIVFQYEKTLEMKEGQVRDIIVYISGEGNATLDISADEVNVAILTITSKDQTGTPLSITSTNTSEYAVTIKVEAIRENKVGIINYDLTVDGTTKTYTTSITIGPPSQQKTSGEINIPTTAIVVVIIIIFVIGYMVYSQIRHKRR